MKRSKLFYTLAAAAIILIGGYFVIDSNSKEASVFTMPDFSVQSDIPTADEQPIQTLQQLNDAIVEVADKTKASVVTINVTQTVEAPENPFYRFFGDPRDEQPEQRRREGLGSGVIVSQDGYVLTNNHVVANADEIIVELSDGNEYEGEIIGRDPRTDIAVVKIDAENLNAIKFGNSDEARVGEMVLAIGSPLGDYLANSVSKGIISAKERAIGLIDQGQGYENFLQTDAAINRGNSGGALVNMNGELIGINSAIASRTGGNIGIGFAVPSNLAQNVMKSLIEDGEVERAYLGIYGRNIDRTLAQALGLENSRGIIINSVQDGTPAAEAGLQEGDVIKTLNGKEINSYASFRTTIATSEPGDKITLGIIRDGESQEIEVTLDKLEQEQTATTQDSEEDMQKNLGFNVEDLTANFAQRLGLDPGQEGVIVSNISEGSDAYQQGLRQYDIITTANKKPVKNIADFREIINNVVEQGNPVVLLQVLRRGADNQFINQYIAFEL